jgi:peptidoglycan/xylan/chitin deacetylase (PgdA/CDA1 family)
MTGAPSGSPEERRGDRLIATVLANRSRHAAFLCYHSVAEEGPPYLTVSPETFERQLAGLRRLGYKSGDARALEALATGWRPPRPLAFLTFDDGFRDTFERVFPLLQAYDFTALVFLVPPLVDSAGALAWPEMRAWRERHPACFRSVSWWEVEVMAEWGIEFGSHTCTHRQLCHLDDERLDQELLESRLRIKERLGRCDTVAYPFGVCTPRVAAAARGAGYRFGFSLPYGSVGIGRQRGATSMSIPRIAIEERDSEWRFRLKLTPADRRLLLSAGKACLRAAEDRRVVRSAL